MTRKGGRRGLRRYADILAMLPACADEIAPRIGMTRENVVNLMRRLKRYGVLRIIDWSRRAPGCQWAEVWMLGDGPDAPHPGLFRGGDPKPRGCSLKRFRADARAFCDLLHALKDGHVILSLIDITGLHKTTTRNLIAYMRSLKLIHVSEWERRFFGGGEPMRVYKLGRKPDSPRPKPTGHIEACRQYRARLSDRAPLAMALTTFSAPLAQASH